VLAVITVLSVWAGCGMVWSGDDFSYLSHFGFADDSPGHFHPVWDFPKFVVSHWLDQNGRAANYIAALLLTWLPERVVMMLSGLMSGLMMWLILIWAGCFRHYRSNASGVLLIGVLALALPWWDSMQVFDCAVNYVWTTGAVLAFLLLLHSRGLQAWPAWAVAVLGFIAGAMHEAATLPVAVGFGILFLLRGQLQGKRNFRVGAIAFVAGVIWCVSSPGIMARAMSDVAPDDSPAVLVLKSCPVVLLLLSVVLVEAFTLKGRQRLSELSVSCWLAFALASVVSAAVCAVGGIVGRSGWFAEVYALIALWLWYGKLACPVPVFVKTVSAALICLVLVIHYYEFATTQWRLGRQMRDVRELYRSSADGVVFYPEAVYEDTLPWWLLWKTRGIPDEDDSYQLERFSHYYSHGDKRLVVIPAAEDRFVTAMDGGNVFEISPRVRVVSEIPSGVVPHTNDREKSSVLIATDKNGGRSVVTPFTYNGTVYYLITPQIIDPGDR